LETSKLQGYNSSFLCLVGVAVSLNVQYGDSTISHKAEVLPEAKAEGPQRKRKKKERIS
jgi:hypothetical protein